MFSLVERLMSCGFSNACEFLSGIDPSALSFATERKEDVGKRDLKLPAFEIESVSETSRLTDSKVELDEEQMMTLNETLSDIVERISEHLKVSITWFRKEGENRHVISAKTVEIAIITNVFGIIGVYLQRKYEYIRL